MIQILAPSQHKIIFPDNLWTLRSQGGAKKLGSKLSGEELSLEKGMKVDDEID